MYILETSAPCLLRRLPRETEAAAGREPLPAEERRIQRDSITLLY